MTGLIRNLNKEISPCPFCAATGTLHQAQKSEQLLIKMHHEKNCYLYHARAATYQMVTEDELKSWEMRAK